MSDLNDLFAEITELEASGGDPDEFPYPPHPVILPDPDFPSLVLSSTQAYIWMEFDEDFGLEILSPLPPNHTITWEADAMGVSELLDWTSWDGPLLALELGVTYRQPFLVRLYVHYYGKGEDTDCEKDWEVVHRSKLSTDETVARFTEWLNRPSI